MLFAGQAVWFIGRGLGMSLPMFSTGRRIRYRRGDFLFALDKRRYRVIFYLALTMAMQEQKSHYYQ
jgi:hypothetical protein